MKAIAVDVEPIREALRLKRAQDELDVQLAANQNKLKSLLNLQMKPVLRVVIDGKIVTASSSNKGRVVQIHVSDLDAVAPDTPPSGGCALSHRGERL